MRRGVLLAGLTVVAATSNAAAQSAKLSVRPRTVEVGEAFRVEALVRTDSGGTPSKAALRTPRHVSTVSGPRFSQGFEMSIRNGTITRSTNVTSSWTARANKVGRIQIGPANIVLNGTAYKSAKITVNVVAAGSKPRRRGGFMGIPGLSWPGFGDDDDDDDDSSLLDLIPEAPQDYQVSTAPDPLAFVRVVATPTRAVIGERILVRAYAYGRPGPFREEDATDPKRDDFVTYSLQEDAHNAKHHRVRIGEQGWYAAKTREWALFPIRGGQLTIGPYTMKFGGASYRQRSGVTRSSPPVLIDVGEPPTKDRPAGYQIGDVGSFTLGATVEPRTVTQGDSISVIVTLSGRGSLPPKLRPPQQNGIVWLEPTITEDIGPKGTNIGGWRKFNYVARVEKSGRVDLGSFKLPFWNPTRDAYQTATANLGTLTVSPSKTVAAVQPKTTSGPEDIAAMRASLGKGPRSPIGWSGRWWFWLGLVGAPALVVATGGAASGSRRWRQRRRGRLDSPKTKSEAALADAKRAETLAETANHIERALVLAIEAACEVRARGVLKADLPARLEKAGLSPDLAADISETLEACDEARFVAAETESPSDLVERGERLIKSLWRSKKRA